VSSFTAQPVIIAIQNGPDVPLNLVGKWLAEAGFDLRTIHAYAHQPLPTNVESLQELLGNDHLIAIIPLGGSIGALDDANAPWLPGERALLKDAVEGGVPVLGLCLGAQLLAASIGGEVSRAPQPEIGIHKVSITDSEDPIFGPLSKVEAVPAIQWHQDMVAMLPTSATTIASSAICQNQIFRIDGIHYGLQFHPEADPTIIRMWEKKADEAYRRSERRVGIAEEVATHMATLESIWRPAIKRWAEMVLSKGATQSRQPTPHQ
jgi:GMP synthase-like glutamine amidotransferase